MLFPPPPEASPASNTPAPARHMRQLTSSPVAARPRNPAALLPYRPRGSVGPPLASSRRCSPALHPAHLRPPAHSLPIAHALRKQEPDRGTLEGKIDGSWSRPLLYGKYIARNAIPTRHLCQWLDVPLRFYTNLH